MMRGSSGTRSNRPWRVCRAAGFGLLQPSPTTCGACRIPHLAHRSIRTAQRCGGQSRSLGLNYTTAPEGGRARFIPYVLHQICQNQQLDADDPVRCDYWMDGKTDGPMSFAGETVYTVRWTDGATASGRFDPEQSRSAGTVTLHLRLPKAK